ncbi:HNH endonuclease, partial [Listeria monocytogenes]|uniref:HNH endonuclease n=1 Tax=Listeria monocytogenes TaxID=1639 RepID=UPI003C6D6F2B
MYIHRILMSRHDSKMDIDHIDCDCLNNKKSNLRFVSRSQNQMNQRISSANTSGYKGVSFDKRVQKWAASINANPITERLGFFNSAEQAAEAYA